MIETAHATAPDPMATLRRTAKRLPRPLRGQVEDTATAIEELREILLQGDHRTDNREEPREAEQDRRVG